MAVLDENFWLAISFVIFLYFAYKPIKRSLLNIIDSKISAIQNQVMQAQAAKRDSQELLENIKSEIEKLSATKKKILADATRSTNDFINLELKKLEVVLEKKKHETHSYINSQKAKALHSLQADFVDSVTKLVTEYFLSSDDKSLSDIKLAQHLKGSKPKEDRKRA